MRGSNPSAESLPETKNLTWTPTKTEALRYQTPLGKKQAKLSGRDYWQ